MRPLIYLVLLGALAPWACAAQANEAQAKIDSLRRAAESAKDGPAKARSLCALCWQLRVAGKPDEALAKGRAGLEQARRAGDKAAEAACLKNIGVVFALQGDYAGALARAGEALALYKALRDDSGAAKTLNNIGLVWEHQGDYARALKYMRESLELKMKARDKNQMAFAYINIGYICEAQGDDEAAFRYARKSLDLYRETGNRSGEAHALLNIGNLHFGRGEDSAAQACARRSLQLYRALGDKTGIADALGNIGEAAERRGDFAAALPAYQECLAVYEEINDRLRLADALARAARAHTALGRPGEARRMAARALGLARDIGAAKQAKAAALALAAADSALGDFVSAFAHHKLHKQYSDSLGSDEQTEEIGRLKARFEFDQENAARRQREEAAADRRQIIAWVALGVFCALLFAAGLFAWGWQNKRKANKLLGAQNKVIARQNAELDAALEELRELSQFKENMTSMLVHDLKNSLSTVMGFAELPALGDAREPLRAAARRMNDLAMNMLEVQKFEAAAVRLDIRPVEMAKVLRGAALQVSFLAGQKQIALRAEAAPGLRALADETALARVLDNLLNNAVKFAPRGGRVSARADAADGAVLLVVKDNGPGLPEDKREAVFEKFVKLNDAAGANKSGVGLGLTYCKLAAEAHGGAITAENAPEGGAVFRLTLPAAPAAPGAAGPPLLPDACGAEAARALSSEDRRRLAPALSEMRRHEIYETTEMLAALEALPPGPERPALAEWRRRAEQAVFNLDEETLAALLRQAETA